MSVPALPSVKQSVDVVLYLSPARPDVPDVPDVPVVPLDPLDPDVPLVPLVEEKVANVPSPLMY